MNGYFSVERWLQHFQLLKWWQNLLCLWQQKYRLCFISTRWSINPDTKKISGGKLTGLTLNRNILKILVLRYVCFLWIYLVYSPAKRVSEHLPAPACDVVPSRHIQSLPKTVSITIKFVLVGRMHCGEFYYVIARFMSAIQATLFKFCS